MINFIKKICSIAMLAILLLGCSENRSSISGKIMFSSIGIPQMEMNVYAKNTETGEVFHTSTASEQNTFRIDAIPYGNYVVYAYSKEEEIGEFVLPKKIKLFGGYSKAAMFDLDENDADHALIEIEIKDDQHISGVIIGDWFTAEVPNE